jgi:hypothetical protein
MPTAGLPLMPVILREKGYEFSFFMFDLSEPIHVHVRSGRKQAKFWIDPLLIAWKRGYRPHELNEIERIIRDNEILIRDIWQRESLKRR